VAVLALAAGVLLAGGWLLVAEHRAAEARQAAQDERDRLRLERWLERLR
jgi:hypothetical protein